MMLPLKTIRRPARNRVERDYVSRAEVERDYVSRTDVATFLRVLQRIEDQADKAWREDRKNDAREMWNIIGGLRYEFTGRTCCMELGQ